MVLVAVSLYRNECVGIGCRLDPEISLVTEFLQQIANLVGLASCTGIIATGLVVRVVASVKIVETFGKFGIGYCQNVRGPTLGLAEHGMIATVEPSAAYILTLVTVGSKAGSKIGSVQNPVRSFTGTLGAIKAGCYPGRLGIVVDRKFGIGRRGQTEQSHSSKYLTEIHTKYLYVKDIFFSKNSKFPNIRTA